MPRGLPKNAAGDAATAKATAKPQKGNGNGANLGFEAQLFLAADKLRKNLEPSDYKHVALGLIFLKYISNAFEAKRAALLAEGAAAAEDPDEYLAENLFWVPKGARWSHLQDNVAEPLRIDPNPKTKHLGSREFRTRSLTSALFCQATKVYSGCGWIPLSLIRILM
jgi:type I restriction enzyme M protein